MEIDIGTAGDKDTYVYDPSENNTGLMSKFTFAVNSTTDVGTLGWNGNKTLNQLAIVDGFNAGGTHTCTFSYDDLVRLLTDHCGSVWSQDFSYDQYGNITKSGSISWMPGYNTKNQYATIGATYDLSGNVTYDTFNKYTWNSYGKMGSVQAGSSGAVCGTSGTCVTYDALGRVAEKSIGSAYQEILIGPTGQSALMNGQTPVYTWIPTPGGSKVVVIGSGEGARSYQHLDWLGSARLETSVQNRSVDYDRAFAPYGETYEPFGSTVVDLINFTGDRQGIISGLYDTPNREQMPNQGRWISPDPAGDRWNLYAYPANPNSDTDPTGLVAFGSSGCAFAGVNAASCGMNVNGMEGTNDAYGGMTAFQQIEAQRAAQEEIPPMASVTNLPNDSAHNQTKCGFWCGVGQRIKNGFTGHGFKTNEQLLPILPKGIVTTTETLLWAPTSTSEPNPYVTFATDVAGLVAVTSEKAGKVLGPVSAGVSVWNDQSPVNEGMNALSLVPGLDIPVAFISAEADLANAEATIVLTGMVNSLPPQKIDDGNGLLIDNPALMTDCQAMGVCQ